MLSTHFESLAAVVRLHRLSVTETPVARTQSQLCIFLFLICLANEALFTVFGDAFFQCTR